MSFWYRGEVEAICASRRLDPNLVHAMSLVESAGRTHAYRYEPAFWTKYMQSNPEWDGANPERVSASYGLLQVMFPTAIQFGYDRSDPPEGLFVPTVGLEFGCRVLDHNLKWADGDLEAALAAYNGGRTRDNQPGRKPKRNQAYVDKVLSQLALVKAEVS